MIYTLTKLSAPGWEFTTPHPEVVIWMLEQHVCKLCKTYTEDLAESDYEDSVAFPDNYANMDDEDKIYTLLATSCGAEYCYNEYKDYLSYHRSEVEDWEAMKCVK